MRRCSAAEIDGLVLAVHRGTRSGRDEVHMPLSATGVPATPS